MNNPIRDAFEAWCKEEEKKGKKLYNFTLLSNNSNYWHEYMREDYAIWQAAYAAAQGGLSIQQEPKYTVNGHAIVNRASGEEIPSDEPVFILRARDRYAQTALLHYNSMLDESVHKEVVIRRFNDFAEFSRKYPERMKIPDTDASALTPPQTEETPL